MDVIAAVATGKAACAIGILRLSGEGCAEVAGRVFRLESGAPLSSAPNRKLMLGRLYDRQGRFIDQGLAVFSRAPHSYTGEDTVELQCHGSPAVLAAGLAALFAAGARQAKPGEFTRRAFLNGQLDLTQAEAVVDLIDAESEDAAANAAGQLGGALRRSLEPVYDRLTDLCSHFHAVLDYPDEDIEEFTRQELQAALDFSADRLNALCATYTQGRHVKHGVKTVLLGRPNAGKSSLLNALAGYSRVIVTDVAGTTRDTVEEPVRLGRVLLRLTDTAGIRDPADQIEALGVERSEQEAAEAELAILVCDGSQPLNEEDRRAMELARRAPHCIAVINKSDLPQCAEAERLPFDEVIRLSALTGENLSALTEAICRRFSDAPCDGTLLTNARQLDALSRAAENVACASAALGRGLTPDAVLTDVEAAMEAIGEVTGATVRQDIVDRIFERFCVGK